MYTFPTKKHRVGYHTVCLLYFRYLHRIVRSYRLLIVFARLRDLDFSRFRMFLLSF